MPLYVSSTCAHHQEVKIVLYSIWYHHTYRCDDTRCCIIQCWPPDDEHMCSKHIEAWNKLIVKQKFCSSSWLITEINVLRCTVGKTSKKSNNMSLLPSFLNLSRYPLFPLLMLPPQKFVSPPYFYVRAKTVKNTNF